MRAVWAEEIVRANGPEAEACLVGSREKKEVNVPRLRKSSIGQEKIGRAVGRDKVTEKEGSQILWDFVRPTKASL